jgi:hypothetical protein
MNLEQNPNRGWICLAVALVAAAVIFFAIKQTQARRAAIRGEHPNQVDFSR